MNEIKKAKHAHLYGSNKPLINQEIPVFTLFKYFLCGMFYRKFILRLGFLSFTEKTRILEVYPLKKKGLKERNWEVYYLQKKVIQAKILEVYLLINKVI